jgi:hypothetical protein
MVPSAQTWTASQSFFAIGAVDIPLSNRPQSVNGRLAGLVEANRQRVRWNAQDFLTYRDCAIGCVKFPTGTDKGIIIRKATGHVISGLWPNKFSLQNKQEGMDRN